MLAKKYINMPSHKVGAVRHKYSVSDITVQKSKEILRKIN
jgi:hypothetical protein